MKDLIIQSGESDNSPISIFVPSGLISVDSALVYRTMNIGTAKPDQKTLNKSPHHLIDIIDPAEVYSAGQFREDALVLMQQSVSNQRTPLLVGGTMLYFNTLQKGMANMPEVADSVRQAIENEAKTEGIQKMHNRLKSVDPVSAERIHPNDSQRVKRALELYDYTGKTLTEYWAEQAKNQSKNNFPYRRIKIALVPEDRVELRKRITLRFDLMLKQGFIEEVEVLFKQGDLHAEMPSIRAVGYRQVWAYLAGDYGYDEMREKAIIATAQLAKRQMTWLRKENDCNFIDPITLNTEKVLKNLKFLLS